MKFKLSLFSILLMFSMLFTSSGIAAKNSDTAETSQNLQSLLGSGFTYQGRLMDDGAPANGTYEFRFHLWADPTSTTLLGSFPPSGTLPVPVVDGYFTVTLDFGEGIFTGEPRWLEIEVNGTPLSPVQPLTASPYAHYSGATSWNGLLNVPSGFADEVDNDILGSLSCANGEIAEWTASSATWVCGTAWTASNDGAGSGLDADLLDGQHASSFAGTVHDHLGQTWTGSSSSLTIEGSFGSPNYASLSLSNSYPSGEGLHVVSAGDDGVHIHSVGGDGVSVWSASDDGVGIDVAMGDGVWVGSAGSDGLDVYQASDNGVSITFAGIPTTSNASTLPNGFKIEGAEGNGLFVGRADNHGVHVESTGNDGIRVDDAYQDGVQIGNGSDFPLYGLYIPSPGTAYTALWPNTANTDGEWGLYTPDKISAGNVTTSTVTVVAQVSGQSTLTVGDLVAAVGIADPIPGILSAVPLVTLADTSHNGIIGVVESRMVLQQAEGKEDGIQMLRSVPGSVRDGDYVALTVFGIAEVKVDTWTGEIDPGLRLTASDTAGHVRGLRSETLNGMLVMEGAPVVGIALATPTTGETTIPVFVTLR